MAREERLELLARARAPQIAPKTEAEEPRLAPFWHAFDPGRHVLYRAPTRPLASAHPVAVDGADLLDEGRVAAIDPGYPTVATTEARPVAEPHGMRAPVRLPRERGDRRRLRRIHEGSGQTERAARSDEARDIGWAREGVDDGGRGIIDIAFVDQKRIRLPEALQIIARGSGFGGTEPLCQQICSVASREHDVQSLFLLDRPRERKPRKVNCRVLGQSNPPVPIAPVQSPALVYPERAAPHEAAYDHDAPAVSGERRLRGAYRHGSEACVGQL
ncbi:hypothetical protein [Sorangium sp. So ce513]|uniref:hypothetical protein n=1 Tax=Sorangium sp. So ce513 TaxID=3133315 RepID=UPI003F611E99